MNVPGHDHELRSASLECHSKPRPVRDAPGQPIETMDHDAVRAARRNLIEESGESRTVRRRAAFARVVEALLDRDPALRGMRSNQCQAGVALGVARCEVATSGASDGLARVDGASNGAPFHLLKISRAVSSPAVARHDGPTELRMEPNGCALRSSDLY
jgi:hypothetical protein